MDEANTDLISQIRTLGDVPRIHTKFRPDAVASKFEGRMTTYAELDAYTNKVANALIAEGVAKGTRVGYLGKNSDYYFELLFGVAKMGAVSLPIGWRLAAPEIGYILNNGEISLLFVGAEFAELAEAAVKEAEREIRVILLESDAENGFVAWRDAQSADDPGVEIDPGEATLQLYTSGTTGFPKGVMLSHDNLLKMWSQAGSMGYSWFEWDDDDVCLVAMPVSHVGGTSWAIIAYLYGATAFITREFNPAEVLEAMASESLSKMFLVPAALNFLIQMPGSRDIDYSNLKVIFYGASPIPLDLLRACMDVFKCKFAQQYGMTEAAGTIVYLPPEDHDPEGNPRMRSAGLPMPGVELKIIDGEGNALGAEEVGEVAVRSQCVMLGYWKNDEATAKTLDSDGWLSSGDAGYLDEDGYLYIHDRVKDMIISGAENIYPAEVESALFGHPAIAEVAVIGVPDEKWGEAVKAVVALKPGAEASEGSILEFTRSRIAAFKVPKSVDFIDALPRNASGKVLKRTLREPYWAGKERNVN